MFPDYSRYFYFIPLFQNPNSANKSLFSVLRKRGLKVCKHFTEIEFSWKEIAWVIMLLIEVHG